MLTRSIGLMGAAALLCGLAAPAHAHDTWMTAKQTRVEAQRAVQLDLTTGNRYPVGEDGSKPDRISRAACLQGMRNLELLPVARGSNATRLVVLPPAASALTCVIELKPLTVELPEAVVAIYLDEIRAPASIRQAWAAMPSTAAAPRRWVESYTKHAKVMLAAGPDAAPPAGGFAPAAAGLALELVPEADLSQGKLSAGQLPLRLLQGGQPLAGQAVELINSADGKGTWQTTDAQGRAVFPAPGAGRYLLRTTVLQPPQAPGAPWTSRFTTLAFDLLP
ncbi:MAG: DUF4198 domain-containing protein [Burkholderiaceae bacterium]